MTWGAGFFFSLAFSQEILQSLAASWHSSLVGKDQLGLQWG